MNETLRQGCSALLVVAVCAQLGGFASNLLPLHPRELAIAVGVSGGVAVGLLAAGALHLRRRWREEGQAAELAASLGLGRRPVEALRVRAMLEEVIAKHRRTLPTITDPEARRSVEAALQRLEAGLAKERAQGGARADQPPVARPGLDRETLVDGCLGLFLALCVVTFCAYAGLLAAREVGAALGVAVGLALGWQLRRVVHRLMVEERAKERARAEAAARDAREAGGLDPRAARRATGPDARLIVALAMPPPGTRAFEAYHTIALIEDLLAERRDELSRASGTPDHGRLTREIANLEGQLEVQLAILRANDLSPGLGRIGVDPSAPPGPVGPRP